MAEKNRKQAELKTPVSLYPIYFYISKSQAVLEDKIIQIKKAFKDVIDFEMDFKVFYGGEDFDSSQFTAFCGTPSLSSDKKLAVIKNFEKISASSLKLVREFVNSIDSKDFDTVLLITSTKEKTDSEVLKAAREKGMIEKLSLPVSENLNKWLNERAELDGIKFTAKASSKLIENVNFDLGLLKKEYEKLCTYIITEKEKLITEKIINKLVARIYDMKIFDLVDFIGNRDKKNALIALKAIAREKQNTIGIITLLHRMFKSFLYAKSSSGQVLIKNYVERNIGHVPFMVGKVVSNYTRASRNYSVDEIISIFNILNNYDILLRQTNVEDINIILKMITDITTIKN